jgi:hypothetical protein
MCDEIVFTETMEIMHSKKEEKGMIEIVNAIA